MAFTKKFAKSKKEAPKTAASYARKKRQEEEVEEVEVEEVEEVEAEAEEVQDDYDEQEEAPAPAPRRSAAPAPRAQQAPRQAPRQSFGGHGGGQGGGQGEQKKALRLTGLFAGKREGCYSGKLRDEDADNLAALIEEAKATNQQVVFFVWENQGNPQFSLTANISAPFQKGGFNRGGNGGGGFNRGGNGGGFRKRW